MVLALVLLGEIGLFWEGSIRLNDLETCSVCGRLEDCVLDMVTELYAWLNVKLE